jgi:predicted dehydrogenase
MKKKVWLIGTGAMAVEYAKVLKVMDVEFITIGRGEKNIKNFKEKTGLEAIPGGIDDYINRAHEIPDYAIVAAGVEALAETTITLINSGITNILCEKPGGLNSVQILKVNEEASKNNSNVLLAYNRRFYTSVSIARQMITEDGGVLSFFFDFSENSPRIEAIEKPPGVKENWFMANSTHVVDLAFHLGGAPDKMECYTAGELSWHKPSIFTGSGISNCGALFSYHADWNGPGRWGVEMITAKRKLVLRPMEYLHIQHLNSFSLDKFEADYSIDEKYKPGVYNQVKAFLHHDYTLFSTIHNQADRLSEYEKILGN